MPFSLQDLLDGFTFFCHQKVIVNLSCRHFLQDPPVAPDFGNPSIDHIRQRLYVRLYFFQGIDTCIDDIKVFKAPEHGPHIFLCSFRTFLCQNPVRELDTWWNFFISFENTYSHVLGDCFELEFSRVGESVRLTLAGGLALFWEKAEGIFWMEFTDQKLGAGRTKRGRKVEKLADLRILVDVSCVEVYLNGGKDVFSTRFYPDTEGVSVKLQAPGSEGRIRLRQDEEQPE